MKQNREESFKVELRKDAVICRGYTRAVVNRDYHFEG